MNADSVDAGTGASPAGDPPAGREALAVALRNRTYFDLAPDGILVADPRGVYLDANPAICRMLGYARDELVGMQAADIVASSEPPGIVPAPDAIDASVPRPREWR